MFYLEHETYDVEIYSAKTVLTLFEDALTVLIACKSVVHQVESLIGLARSAIEFGFHDWAAQLSFWIQEDLNEIDAAVESLSDARLRPYLLNTNEASRLIMYKDLMSSVADLKNQCKEFQEELPVLTEAPPSNCTESSVTRVESSYFRLCSYYPAHQYLADILDSQPTTAVWLATFNAMALTVRKIEDSLIYLVGRSEFEESVSDYEQMPSAGRLLVDKVCSQVQVAYDARVGRYNDLLGWQVSPILSDDNSLVSFARSVHLQSGEFAWGCREVDLRGDMAIDDIFVIYVFAGQKVAQLIREPYPRGFPAAKVVEHVDSVFASLADSVAEELDSE